MLHPEIHSELESRLGLIIKGSRPVSGGDISSAFMVQTTSINLFLKVNQSTNAYYMFAAEAKGLDLIGQTKCIRVPEVVHFGQTHGSAFLVLEAIESKRANHKDLQNLGEQLAKMHGSNNVSFGQSNDNFIGSFPQSNKVYENWIDFYAEQRLLPQYVLAKNNGYLGDHENPNIQTLKNGCSPYFRDIQPSLLHGDLWSGNFMIASNGDPVLIDPAVYYGHSEVDIAMSLLFGGYGSSFYDSYFKIHPKTNGFKERIELYQLYYLLVHLNLFGTAYKPSVMNITKTYFRL